jgi:hypothetical protein
MTYGGGCHCGDIRYRLDWPVGGGPVPARRCNCSYCTRFNGTWTSHPDAKLAIETGGNPTGQYRFATGTAGFLFCARCGVTVAALDDSGDSLKAVVNVHTLDRAREIEFERSESDFDGEAPDARLERRAARWIGDVTLDALE